MNLESDKRLNIQLRLDFSSAPTGEARQAGREDIESLSAVHEPERPANTCSKRVSATSRTAVYGAVRTVVWEGRSCEAPPYPDRSDFVHWPITTDLTRPDKVRSPAQSRLDLRSNTTATPPRLERDGDHVRLITRGATTGPTTILGSSKRRARTA